MPDDIHYVFPMRVVHCREHIQIVASRKDSAGQRVDETRTLGWFVTLSMLNIALPCGEEYPGFSPGDEVEIVLRRRRR